MHFHHAGKSGEEFKAGIQRQKMKPRPYGIHPVFCLFPTLAQSALLSTQDNMPRTCSTHDEIGSPNINYESGKCCVPLPGFLSLFPTLCLLQWSVSVCLHSPLARGKLPCLRWPPSECLCLGLVSCIVSGHPVCHLSPAVFLFLLHFSVDLLISFFI